MWQVPSFIWIWSPTNHATLEDLSLTITSIWPRIPDCLIFSRKLAKGLRLLFADPLVSNVSHHPHTTPQTPLVSLSLTRVPLSVANPILSLGPELANNPRAENGSGRPLSSFEF